MRTSIDVCAHNHSPVSNAAIQPESELGGREIRSLGAARRTQGCCTQVVRRGNGVDIAGEMEVKLVHWNDL